MFQPAPERLARGAIRKVRPGSIIIFHDGFDGRGGDRASTVAAVKIVVTRLLADGYRFTTVDRLLGLPAYQGENHQPHDGDGEPGRIPYFAVTYLWAFFGMLQRRERRVNRRYCGLFEGLERPGC